MKEPWYSLRCLHLMSTMVLSLYPVSMIFSFKKRYRLTKMLNCSFFSVCFAVFLEVSCCNHLREFKVGWFVAELRQT